MFPEKKMLFHTNYNKKNRQNQKSVFLVSLVNCIVVAAVVSFLKIKLLGSLSYLLVYLNSPFKGSVESLKKKKISKKYIKRENSIFN